MKYRPDIDGLRTVAVLPVVLFHAAVPLFSGGFVGVDIFFVISGFLITSIIQRDVSGGSFSYLHFWEKRVRRIFPASFVCFLISALVFLFVLTPKNYEDFSKSLFFNGVFSTNIFFWKQINYFNPIADSFPLLHTWSLSIEEQFYFFLPLLLIGIYKWKKQFLIPAFSALVCLSFIANVVLYSYRPEATFFLLPTRAWELGAGSLLAFLSQRGELSHKGLINFISLLGFALICVAVFTFDKATAFPSYNALLPVVGTVFIILGRDSFLNQKILSLSPVVWIGKISYSLYLWHWVCLVFLKHRLIYHPSLEQNLIAVGVSVVLSALSYYLVEQPFRLNLAFWNKKRIWSLFGVISVFYLGFGTLGWKSEGFPDRFDNGFYDYQASSPIFDHNGICHKKEGIICKTNLSGEKEIFVWGDSHGQATVGAVYDVAKKLGYKLSFSIKNGCPPLVDGWITKLRSRKCTEHNNEVLNYLKGKEIVPLVIGRYDIYFNQRERYESHSMKEVFLSSKSHPENSVKTTSLMIIKENLMLMKKLFPNILFFFQPPSFEDNPVDIGNKKQIFSIAVDLKRPAKDILPRTASLRESVATLGINSLDPYEVFCPAGICYPYDQEGQSYYFDDDHLSVLGANRLKSLIERQLINF